MEGSRKARMTLTSCDISTFRSLIYPWLFFSIQCDFLFTRFLLFLLYCSHFRHLNRTVVCSNDFISNCLVPEVQKHYRELISGTLTLVDKLCNVNSVFRRSKLYCILFSLTTFWALRDSSWLLFLLSSMTEYLKHARCFYLFSDGYDKCNIEYQNLEKRRESMNGTTLFQLQLWCWWVSSLSLSLLLLPCLLLPFVISFPVLWVPPSDCHELWCCVSLNRTFDLSSLISLSPSLSTVTTTRIENVLRIRYGSLVGGRLQKWLKYLSPKDKEKSCGLPVRIIQSSHLFVSNFSLQDLQRIRRPLLSTYSVSLYVCQVGIYLKFF